MTEQKKLADEVLQAKEQAEESDRMKSAFLSNISHEIRTPLNAITGVTDVFKAEMADRPDLQPFFQMVEENVAILLNVVDGLLEASALEARHGEARFSNWDLDELIYEAVREIQATRKSASTKVVLDVSFDPELVDKIVRTDRDKLLGVFQRLLANAVKYTEEGSITAGYRVEEGELVLFVRDTGIGIADADRKRLFTPFHHGTARHVTLHKGAGLGLYVAERLVRAMGGTIWLDPETEGGACFCLGGVCRVHHPTPARADAKAGTS